MIRAIYGKKKGTMKFWNWKNGVSENFLALKTENGDLTNGKLACK